MGSQDAGLPPQQPRLVEQEVDRAPDGDPARDHQPVDEQGQQQRGQETRALNDKRQRDGHQHENPCEHCGLHALASFDGGLSIAVGGVGLAVPGDRCLEAFRRFLAVAHVREAKHNLTLAPRARGAFADRLDEPPHPGNAVVAFLVGISVVHAEQAVGVDQVKYRPSRGIRLTVAHRVPLLCGPEK